MPRKRVISAAGLPSVPTSWCAWVICSADKAGLGPSLTSLALAACRLVLVCSTIKECSKSAIPPHMVRTMRLAGEGQPRVQPATEASLDLTNMHVFFPDKMSPSSINKPFFGDSGCNHRPIRGING